MNFPRTHAVVVLLACAMSTHATAADPAPPAPQTGSKTSDQPGPAKAKEAAAKAIEAFNKENPGIHIDADKGVVDLTTAVALKDAPNLECLLCTKGTKDHESLLVTEIKPSQLHLALLLL